MKTLRYMAAALAAAGLMAAPASATTFVFKGAGNNVTPLGVSGVDFDPTCATTVAPGDICNVQDDNGDWNSLDYTLDGIDVSVSAYVGGEKVRLIQDRQPKDSGLGAWSELNGNDDQTQNDAGESIEFTFGSMVKVTDVEFNAGSDTSCTNVDTTTIEGTCGEFLLEVFDATDTLIFSLIYDITNTDVLAQLGVAGVRFVLTALTPEAGFVVAKFTVSEVPVPAALPLLISGLAGLGFASRRRKAAA